MPPSLRRRYFLEMHWHRVSPIAAAERTYRTPLCQSLRSCRLHSRMPASGHWVQLVYLCIVIVFHTHFGSHHTGLKLSVKLGHRLLMNSRKLMNLVDKPSISLVSNGAAPSCSCTCSPGSACMFPITASTSLRNMVVLYGGDMKKTA